LFVTVFNNFMI